MTPLDMLASKLLAKADRWRDAKAETAYGASVKADLGKAVQMLKDRPQRLDKCMQALAMIETPKALL